MLPNATFPKLCHLLRWHGQSICPQGRASAPLARHLAGYAHAGMQFENNRCYYTALRFAVSGTRLLYQQSPELLAKAVPAQTALPGTKPCSQTSPHALQDGQRSKDRGSSRACKKQEHGFITHHNITSREPRQVTEQLARILSRQNFQAPHAAGRTWQCPQAPAPSRSSCSPQLPLSQTPSRGRVMWVQTTSAGGGRTFYSFPSHALQNPAEDSTQSAGQSPLPAPCPRARRVRRPPELLGRRAAPRSSASATASP